MTKQHNYEPCAAKTRSGNQCRKPAGWGTSHAGYGRCRLHGGSSPSGIKSSAMTRAARLVETSGATPRQTDIHEALLSALYSSVGLTDAARAHYAEQLDTTGTPQVDVEAARKTYEQALDRQHSYAKDCAHLGIAARQIDAIERSGETILALLRSVIHDLGIPMDEAQPVLIRHLSALEMTA